MPPSSFRLISQDPDVAARGHFAVALNPPDIEQFKTPSLCQVAASAPYMHDDSVATLREAVQLELYSFYAEGGGEVANSRRRTIRGRAMLHISQTVPKALSSASPMGTPQPDTASNPRAAEYPFPGLGCEAFCPETMSRNPFALTFEL